MPGPQYGVVPSGFNTRYSQFTVTNTTIAKVLVETQAAAAASGNNPAYYGGFSLIELVASSTDGTARDIILWEGEVLTTQETTNTGTMATTATTNGTITRASGSFITDGWKIGDGGMIFTPDNTAQAATGIDGIKFVITAVAAGTITVSGTPYAANAGLTAGTRLVRVSQLARHTIAINAGNTTTSSGTPNVNLLNQSMDYTYNKFDRKFGPTSMLIGGMQANVSALTAQIGVLARYAKY